MMWMHRAVVPLLALLLLALAGCSGDDPEPKFEPTPSSAPTSASVDPTQSPTGPVEPTLPVDAEADTKVGAEAFVRYWIELVNFAQATGVTAKLERLNDMRCSGCRGVTDAIGTAYETGGRIEGGEWSAGRMRELPLDYGADWAAFARARTDAQAVFDSDGHKTKYSGAPFRLFVYVAWTDGAWTMRWLRTPS